MSFDADTLLRLLPGIHRARDVEIAAGLTNLLTDAESARLVALEALAVRTADEQTELTGLRDRASRGPLQDLLRVFADEIGAVEENLEQLYDDLFIETCAAWAIPYIGDLIGYRLLHGHGPSGDRRAEVAHTIAFRRRKGTLAMLEQLARDVTGWNARAVEFFRLTRTSQYMNHVRLGHTVMPDLRDGLAMERFGTAFDSIPRTLEVRRIATGRGRYNLPNVGLFVWRLDALRRGPGPAAPHPGDASGRRFRFSPLGNDVPLHTRPRDEESIDHLADPLNVPEPIRRRVFDAMTADYVGSERSVLVTIDGVERPVCSCNLSDDPDQPGEWAHEPPADSIAIDPVLGRLAVGADLPTSVPVVTFHEGGPDEIGGGAYSRAATFESGSVARRVPNEFATIQAALDALGGDGAVEITDSGRYEEALSIQVAEGATIELRAADGHRPLLFLTAPLTVEGETDSRVILNGLLIAGDGIEVPDTSELAHLDIRHCTLVPGRTLATTGVPEHAGAPSVTVELGELELSVERSILGPVRMVASASATLTDSIVDATDTELIAFASLVDTDAGGRLALEACTVVGEVHALILEISNSILLSTAVAERRQEGCVRFSFLPATSVVPRRYRCQPDAETGASNAPTFATLRFGAVGYARLTTRTPIAIRQGADDESEMGVWHYRYEPQRESDLVTRLDEYLRVGLEAGILHAS